MLLTGSAQSLKNTGQLKWIHNFWISDGYAVLEQ